MIVSRIAPASNGAPRAVDGVDGSASSVGAPRRGVRIAAAPRLPLVAVAARGSLPGSALSTGAEHATCPVLVLREQSGLAA